MMLFKLKCEQREYTEKKVASLFSNGIMSAFNASVRCYLIPVEIYYHATYAQCVGEEEKANKEQHHQQHRK